MAKLCRMVETIHSFLGCRRGAPSYSASAENIFQRGDLFTFTSIMNGRAGRSIQTTSHLSIARCTGVIACKRMPNESTALSNNRKPLSRVDALQDVKPAPRRVQPPNHETIHSSHCFGRSRLR